MRDTRRLLAVLTLGLLISAFGATALREADDARATGDGRSRVATAATTTSTTTTLAPAPPATPLPVRPRSAGPVRVPANPYAEERLTQIGFIDIPKIGLRHTVFEGITLRTIDNGPSHWPGTAMPGQRGNTVFAGHRVTHSKPFRNIDQLVPGDEVIFTVGGNRSVYTVTGHEIVSPKELRIVDQTAAATGTLFACHPPGSAKFRYVVRLALVLPGAGQTQNSAPGQFDSVPPSTDSAPPPSSPPNDGTLPTESGV